MCIERVQLLNRHHKLATVNRTVDWIEDTHRKAVIEVLVCRKDGCLVGLDRDPNSHQPALVHLARLQQKQAHHAGTGETDR